MKIQEQDVYHGPALAQIAEYPAFKALNKASSKQGHYIVNADRRMLLKYSTKARGPRGPWKFTFTPDDLAVLAGDARGARTFAVMACGHVTVCILTFQQFEVAVDVSLAQQQSMTVEFPPNGGLRVAGSLNRLHEVIAHNAFPKTIFA